MTNIPTDESRLLVLFGEMRGDLKSLLKSQEELAKRLGRYEEDTDLRMAKLEARVRSLEAVRWKVAGFTTAIAAAATLFAEKIGGFLSKLPTILGG